MVKDKKIEKKIKKRNWDNNKFSYSYLIFQKKISETLFRLVKSIPLTSFTAFSVLEKPDRITEDV